VIRTVHLRDLGGYVSRIPKERHAAAVRGVRRCMRQRGRVIVNEEINATKPRPPVDRRTYANSWETLAIENGCRIYSTDPKASIVDRGRRPGAGVSRAGIEALMGWVHRHGMDTVSAPAAQRVARQQMMQRALGIRAITKAVAKREQVGAAARSIAYAIAGAIKKRGLWMPKGLRVFERASRRIVEECRAAVHMAIAGAEFQERH
jgi:hypothetical protein